MDPNWLQQWSKHWYIHCKSLIVLSHLHSNDRLIYPQQIRSMQTRQADVSKRIHSARFWWTEAGSAPNANYPNSGVSPDAGNLDVGSRMILRHGTLPSKSSTAKSWWDSGRANWKVYSFQVHGMVFWEQAPLVTRLKSQPIYSVKFLKCTLCLRSPLTAWTSFHSVLLCFLQSILDPIQVSKCSKLILFFCAFPTPLLPSPVRCCWRCQGMLAWAELSKILGIQLGSVTCSHLKLGGSNIS